MNTIFEKEKVLKEMLIMCNLLNKFPNSKKYQSITLDYLDLIISNYLFGDEEIEKYYDIIYQIFEKNNLDTSFFCLEEDLESNDENYCYERTKKMFESFNIREKSMNEISYMIDYIDNSNIINEKQKKDKYSSFNLNEIVALYEKYLNSFSSPLRKKWFKKLKESDKFSVFFLSRLDLSGSCYNLTKRKKYIFINSSDCLIEKKLTFFHELEHAYIYEYEEKNSSLYGELSSILSELYAIDFFVDTDKINEKRYIFLVIKFIREYLFDILNLYEEMIDYESGILNEIFSESDVKYISGFIGALHYYFNYSREDALNTIENKIKNNTIDNFIPNIDSLLRQLNIYIDGLICRYNEIDDIRKISRKKGFK